MVLRLVQATTFFQTAQQSTDISKIELINTSQLLPVALLCREIAVD